MAELVHVLSDSDENVEFEGFVVSPEERARYAELVRKRSVEEAFGSTVNELSDDDDSTDHESEEDEADDNENEDDLSDEDFDSKEEINGVLSDDSLDGALAGVSDQCPICLMSLKEQLLGTPDGCQHVFCLDCIREWANNVNTCPVGRRPFHEIRVHATKKGPILQRISVEDRQYEGNDELFEDDDPTYCQVCTDCDREDCLLLCDNCDNGYHMDCLAPPLEFVPIDEWFCPVCRPHHVAETHDSDTAEELQSGETSQARLRSSRAQQNAERGSTSTQARATSSRASARTVASVRSNRTAERRTPRRGEGRRGRGRTKSRTGSSRRTRSSSTGEKRRKRKTSKHRRKKSGTRKKTRGTKKTTKSRAKRQKKEQDEPFFELQFAPAKRGKTVRARLHESLGPSHSTGGEQVRNPGRCSLPSRMEPSMSFAVFGNSFALYDFNEEESAEKDEAMTSAPSSEPGNPDVLGSILEGLDTLRSEEVTRDGHVLPQRLRKTPTTSAATSYTANSSKVSQALINQDKFDEKDNRAVTKSRERSANESADSSSNIPVEQQRVSDKVSTQMSDFALFRLNRRAARSSGSSSSLSTKKASATTSAELAGYKIPRKTSTSAASANPFGCVSDSKCTGEVVRPAQTNECKNTIKKRPGFKIPRASSSSSIKWNVLRDKKPVTSVTGSCAFASKRSSDMCVRTPSANRDEKLPVTLDRESVRFRHQSACVSATDKKVETAMDRIPDSVKKSSLMERESVDPKLCSATKGKLCAGDLPSLQSRSQSYSSPSPCVRTSQSSFPNKESSTRNRVAFAPPIHQRRDNLQIIQMLKDKRENMMAKDSIEGKGKEFARDDTKSGSSFLPVAVVKPSLPSTFSDATSELSAKPPAVVLHSAAMQKEESGLLKNCQETRNTGKETEATKVPQENERDKQRRLGIARLSHIQQIADEVRLALKPYYKQSVVNKEEYKNIMRRAVEKIRNSQSGVDRTRVCSLVDKYVKKMKAER